MVSTHSSILVHYCLPLPQDIMYCAVTDLACDNCSSMDKNCYVYPPLRRVSYLGWSQVSHQVVFNLILILL